MKLKIIFEKLVDKGIAREKNFMIATRGKGKRYSKLIFGALHCFLPLTNPGILYNN